MKNQNKKKITPTAISTKFLRGWPLPEPSNDSDKDDRGRVLIIAGANEMPGAVILAATAALRAGAGKLQIATCQSIASLVAVAVPESRVFGLAETKSGGISFTAAGELAERANQVDAVLIGPGMLDETGLGKLLKLTLPKIDKPALVLDATAFVCLSQNPKCLHHLNGRAILTPHAGEMASIMKMQKSEVVAHADIIALEAASQFHAVVALKGASTLIADVEGNLYRNSSGNVGLATSGSGDTLSGVIAGLLARGADAAQAAAWGVYLHAMAGNALAKKIGPLGFLARELLSEIPQVMAKI